MTEIIIAEDRLQRLETYANEEENGEMIEVITAYRTLITTIESQKEEIERLKKDSNYWNNEHSKETVRADKLQQQISAFQAWQPNSWDSHLHIESLKAITELAVKGLEMYANEGGKRAKRTLSEIEKLQK